VYQQAEAFGKESKGTLTTGRIHGEEISWEAVKVCTI
jgi:hypothetical protein